MAEELCLRCRGDRQHVHLLDGKVAQVAIYPEALQGHVVAWQDKRRMMSP